MEAKLEAHPMSLLAKLMPNVDVTVTLGDDGPHTVYSTWTLIWIDLVFVSFEARRPCCILCGDGAVAFWSRKALLELASMRHLLNSPRSSKV
jgi:hypothetical protein